MRSPKAARPFGAPRPPRQGVILGGDTTTARRGWRPACPRRTEADDGWHVELDGVSVLLWDAAIEHLDDPRRKTMFGPHVCKAADKLADYLTARAS